MTAGLAGDSDASLPFGDPENGAAGRAFEEAIKMLLCLSCFSAGKLFPDGIDGFQKTGIFQLPLPDIPAEHPEIGDSQNDQRQVPENGAQGAGDEQIQKQHEACQIAKGHG